MDLKLFTDGIVIASSFSFAMIPVAIGCSDSSRFSKADRKNFFVIARGSAFECSAALDKIENSQKKNFSDIKSSLEEISKMLFKMISNLKNQIEAKK